MHDQFFEAIPAAFESKLDSERSAILITFCYNEISLTSPLIKDSLTSQWTAERQ